MKHNFKFYCKDYENIENYNKAKEDNFKNWCCHHRLETHTSDGERRLVDITAEELQALDMYYDRPAEELIFMKHSEHSSLHSKGEHNQMYGKKHSEEARNKMSCSWNYDKHFTEETKKKMSEQKKCEKNPFYGKRHTEETKNIISEKKRGKTVSAEVKTKMSEAHKGQTPWNKGKQTSEETKNKLSVLTKGTHWYNNGEKCIRAKDCPPGFVPGRLQK